MKRTFLPNGSNITQQPSFRKSKNYEKNQNFFYNFRSSLSIVEIVVAIVDNRIDPH